MYCNNCGTNIGDLKFCPSCGTEAYGQTDNKNAERILEDLTLNDVHFYEGHSFSYKDDGAIFNYINAGSNFITDKHSKFFKKLPIVFVVSVLFFILMVLLISFGIIPEFFIPVFIISAFILFQVFFVLLIYHVIVSFMNRELLTISVTPNEVNVYNNKNEIFLHLSKDDIYQFYFIKRAISTNSSSSSSSTIKYLYKLYIKTVKDVLIGKDKNKSTNKIDLGIQMSHPKEVRFLEQEFEKILGIADKPVEDEFEYTKKQYTTIKNNLNGKELPKPEFTKNITILQDDDRAFFLKREFNFILFKKISNFLIDGKTLKISDSSLIGKDPNKEKSVNIESNSCAVSEEQERDGKTMYYYQNKDNGFSSYGFSTSGDPAFIRIYCVKFYPNINNRFEYIVLMHSLTFEEAEYMSYRINRILEKNR